MSDAWFYGDWTRPKYGQSHRHYHQHDHVDRMLTELEKWRPLLDTDEYIELQNAIEFHDVIWQPDRQDNEERSIAYAKTAGVGGDVFDGLVMATKAPFEPKSDLEKLMVYIDWSNFMADDYQTHLTNMQILREYQMHPIDKYIQGRNAFFDTARMVPSKLRCDRFISQKHADDLAAGINNADLVSRAYRPKIGIYVGSFNPFHDGHWATVMAAERFYDKVILVQATSAAKAANGLPDGFPPFLERYYETYRFLDGSSMQDILRQIATPGIADYTLIRGIRNGTDLTAEQTYARILRDMGVSIPIHHILSDAEYQHISSSAVREIRKYGGDLYTRIWQYKATDDEF